MDWKDLRGRSEEAAKGGEDFLCVISSGGVVLIVERYYIPR